jgi:hypothetical protein
VTGHKSASSRPRSGQTIQIDVRLPQRIHFSLSIRSVTPLLLGFLILHPSPLPSQCAAVKAIPTCIHQAPPSARAHAAKELQPHAKQHQSLPPNAYLLLLTLVLSSAPCSIRESPRGQ